MSYDEHLDMKKEDEMSVEDMDKIRSKGSMVHHPKHYSLNEHGIECIEAIEASMSTEGFQGMCKGNVIKYLWRYKYKGNPLQDLEKAQWYLDRLIESISSES